MTDNQLSMPLAIPIEGVDPISYYLGFAGKLTASWTPTDGLVVWVASESTISKLHAPVKSAMKFVPAETVINEETIISNTLVLKTWPTDYVSIKETFPSAVPSEIRIENVDSAEVRSAVTPIFTAMGRSDTAVDEFMLGNGLVKATAGIPVGAAAAGSDGPSADTPNYVNISMFDGYGNSINPVQFLSDAAGIMGIDKDQHPLLSQLDLDGWIEVVALDVNDEPLVNEPYTLYLADGTNKSGVTDADGRIYETNLSSEEWAIDLPNHPSFHFVENQPS